MARIYERTTSNGITKYYGDVTLRGKPLSYLNWVTSQFVEFKIAFGS